VAAIKPGLAETPMTAALDNGLPRGGLELIAAKNEGHVALALRLGRDTTWRNDMSRRITATGMLFSTIGHPGCAGGVFPSLKKFVSCGGTGH
jgi:hypothetical protein